MCCKTGYDKSVLSNSGLKEYGCTVEELLQMCLSAVENVSILTVLVCSEMGDVLSKGDA